MTTQPHDATAPEIKDASPGTTDWAAAAKQVRLVSDWLTKAFLGIGTLLIGTGPLLAHVGGLHADLSGLLAGIAAAVALFGVGAVIWFASDINLTRVTDVTELAAPAANSSTARLLDRIMSSPYAVSMYLGNQTSVAKLLDRRNQEARTLAEQIELSANQGDPLVAAQIDQLAAETRANIAAYDRIITDLQGWAGYQFIRDRFDQRRPWIFAAATCTAVGVAVWVFIVGGGNPSTSAEASIAPGSTVASSAGPIGVITWTHAGDNASAATELRQQLGLGGKECETVDVVVQGGTGNPTDPWQVATLPRQQCPNISFTVDRRLATFTGFDPSLAKKVTVNLAPSWADRYWLLISVIGVAVGSVLAVAIQRVFRTKDNT
jgi:hypothetical protein